MLDHGMIVSILELLVLQQGGTTNVRSWLRSQWGTPGVGMPRERWKEVMVFSQEDWEGLNNFSGDLMMPGRVWGVWGEVSSSPGRLLQLDFHRFCKLIISLLIYFTSSQRSTHLLSFYFNNSHLFIVSFLHNRRWPRSTWRVREFCYLFIFFVILTVCTYSTGDRIFSVCGFLFLCVYKSASLASSPHVYENKVFW